MSIVCAIRVISAVPGLRLYRGQPALSHEIDGERALQKRRAFLPASVIEGFRKLISYRSLLCPL